MCSIQLPGERPAKGSSQIQCPTPTPNLNSWVSPPLSSAVSWVWPLENGRGHFPFWSSAPPFITGTSLITQISGRGSKDALIGSQNFQGISFPLPTLLFLGLVQSFSVDPGICLHAWSLELPENPGRGSISQLPQSTGFLQVRPQIQTLQTLAYRKIQMQ